MVHRFKLNKILFCSLLLLVGLLCQACHDEQMVNVPKRTFQTSFETVDDFSGFYITPQAHLNSSYHALNDSMVHSGTYSHKAWITGANSPSLLTNNNHRAYPTVQLYKTNEGAFKTPCYVTFWVWLDMELKASTTGGDNDWFSFATFTCDESDNWTRTVLVNLSYDGFVHLMHVPGQGEQNYIFQTQTLKFPQKEWVELKIYLDFTENAYAKVWQNGELVSSASIQDVENKLAQAHFGLYCPPSMASGVVYNDDLKIEMVDTE